MLHTTTTDLGLYSEISALKSTLSAKGDGVIGVLQNILETLQNKETEYIQVEEPSGEAFTYLRTLNKLEDLALDKTGDCHEQEFAQYKPELEECLSNLPEDKELHNTVSQVSQPFKHKGTNPKAIKERAQRLVLIQQLRMKIVHYSCIASTSTNTEGSGGSAQAS